MTFAPANHLADITRSARSRYAELVGNPAACSAWWTAVVLTAGSARQADRYRWEIQRRLDQTKLPASAQYLAVPDPDGCRIGSGGATLNALRALAQHGLTDWARQRILILHSGGDSRRLPQYSPSGKLFTALPVKTPWGEVSSVFDEMLALSLGWARQLPAGVLVGSGDVLLTFDAAALDWSLPGVCGVAMRQPVSVGARHGVYVLDERGRVYAFLQKPSLAEVRAAGGLLEGDQVRMGLRAGASSSSGNSACSSRTTGRSHRG